MSTPLGPQQFDLVIQDTFATRNPADEVAEISPTATVPVTLFWNLDRTELDERKDVQFATVRWTGAGPGPHPVFAEGPTSAARRTGTVEWRLATEVQRRVEANAAGTKVRLIVTPLLRLLRTVTPADGGTPWTEEAGTASSTVRGNWTALPEPAAPKARR